MRAVRACVRVMQLGDSRCNRRRDFRRERDRADRSSRIKVFARRRAPLIFRVVPLAHFLHPPNRGRHSRAALA